MSGGGGGDDTWRKPAKPVGKPGTADDPCAIDEITTLNSPNRAVLATLSVGHVLNLVLEMGPPRRLLARTVGGQTAGSITSPSLPQIIGCIQGGASYQLEVTSLRGAVCQVRIFKS
jgi:hypothetical protein